VPDPIFANARFAGIYDDLDADRADPAHYLVLETRDPAERGWEEWTREASFRRLDLPAAGIVESWVELTDVAPPMVSFRWTYRFESDSAVPTSDSTLRFRDRESIETSLSSSGFGGLDVRDAPDRPGKEFVFVAGRVG
jgi:hypothetical protein